jgi:drug/metabolite transporter (DMT)-like permease
VAGIAGFTAVIYAAKYLPIFVTMIISNLNPFWSAIIGYYLNNEVMDRSTFVCMIGCLAGVIIVALSKTTEAPALELDVTSAHFYVGLACILLDSVAFSIFGTFMRKMREMHWSVI